MKNKVIKYTLNGVILAAVAAFGIAAYQIGTTPSEEKIFQELQDDETEDYAMLEEKMAENEDLDDWDVISDEEQSLETEVNEINSEEVGSYDIESVLGEEETSVESNLIDIEVPEESWEVVDTSSQNILEQLSFSEEAEMQWPVHGNILLDYDMTQSVYFPTLDQYRLSSAIAVQAEEGQPVAAAASGVVYEIVNNVKTGNTVTMELGDGYQAIYGQLQELNIEEGDFVEQGEIIGYVSAPTKYYSVEGSNLYFAMKQNGEPVDPRAYLKE